MSKNTPGGKRPGAGRPPVLNPKKPRAFAVTDDDWNSLKRLAEKENTSISQLIIRKVLYPSIDNNEAD